MYDMYEELDIYMYFNVMGWKKVYSSHTCLGERSICGWLVYLAAEQKLIVLGPCIIKLTRAKLHRIQCSVVELRTAHAAGLGSTMSAT
jgi:hypothetical protein